MNTIMNTVKGPGVPGRIDPVAALAMLAAGARKADVARRFGVSRAAVTLRLRGILPALPAAPGAPLDLTVPLLRVLGRDDPEAADTLRSWASRLELRPDLVLVHVKASWLGRDPMTALARRKATLEAAWGRPVAFRWPPSP